MERGILAMVGIGLALFGGTFLSYFVGQFSSGGNGKTEPSVYMGLIVFFALMTATGLFLAWRMYFVRPTATGEARPGHNGSGAGSTGTPGPGSTDSPTGPTPTSRRDRPQPNQDEPSSPPATPAERELRVLHLAERRHGRLTVTEASAHCGLTIAESKAELDRLVAANVAEIQVTTAGVLVYAFPGFLSDEEKARATDF